MNSNGHVKNVFIFYNVTSYGMNNFYEKKKNPLIIICVCIIYVFSLKRKKITKPFVKLYKKINIVNVSVLDM